MATLQDTNRTGGHRPLCTRCMKYARYDFARDDWRCPVCMKAVGNESVAPRKPSTQ